MFNKKNKCDFSFANPSQQKHGKVALTLREKDKARMASPRKTSPSHKQIRVMKRRRTLGSGMNFIKSPGITPMNVA